MEAEPIQFLWRRYEERLEPARKALAKFIGAHPKDVVLVTNATTGVNAVMRSLKLKPGDELLTTNHDYNACHNVLVETARRAGAKLVTARVPFPLRSEDEIIEAVLHAITRRTRLAMIDHVSSSTALIFPIERLVRELETRGIDTLVDGAHAPGMFPLRMNKLGAAYYTGNLHKWVCAPKGAAFLWVREDKQTGLYPAVISHGYNTHRPGYRLFQDLFDWPGTFDPSAWLCVPEAIRWMEKLLPGAWPEVHTTNTKLAKTARSLLCESLEVEPPCPESMVGAMATVLLPGKFQGRPRTGKIDREQLELYDKHRIEVPFFRIGKPEHRYFRVSAQLYNTLADFERLARALNELR